MHINSSSPVAVTNPEALPSKHMDGSAAPSKDRIRTSSKAQMLSRNLDTLREQLLPRDAILKKFAGTLDEPLNLDDKTIDHILSRL